MPNVLVLATRNEGKIKELNALLANRQILVKGLNEFPNCQNVVEDGLTFRENARKKAETIANFLKLPALADDSGLEVDALDGRPGVYSARFAGPSATDEENNQKLIESIRDVSACERSARFRCVLAFASPEKPTWFCEGVCEGQVLNEPVGINGFGYDPLFFVPEIGKTMAQLDNQQKNKISHRGKAMSTFLANLDKLW